MDVLVGLGLLTTPRSRPRNATRSRGAWRGRRNKISQSLSRRSESSSSSSDPSGSFGSRLEGLRSSSRRLAPLAAKPSRMLLTLPRLALLGTSRFHTQRLVLLRRSPRCRTAPRLRKKRLVILRRPPGAGQFPDAPGSGYCPLDAVSSVGVRLGLLDYRHVVLD